jgi:hypothetical protein
MKNPKEKAIEILTEYNLFTNGTTEQAASLSLIAVNYLINDNGETDWSGEHTSKYKYWNDVRFELNKIAQMKN